MSTFKQYNNEFSVSDPYQEGQPLDAKAAAVLNSSRAEHISHQLRSFVKSPEGLNIEEPAKHEFTAEEIKAMKGKTKELDKNFEFGAGGGGRTGDPVAVEARRIARSAVDAKLEAAGKTKTKKDEAVSDPATQISHENYTTLVNEVAARPNVLEKAKANVAEAEAAAADIKI